MYYGFIKGDKVDSNNNKQKNDNSMFNKVVADVYKQIRYSKKSVWCYLPSQEHLDSLIERYKKLSIKINLEIKKEKDYIKVRKIINKEK